MAIQKTDWQKCIDEINDFMDEWASVSKNPRSENRDSEPENKAQYPEIPENLMGRYMRIMTKLFDTHDGLAYESKPFLTIANQKASIMGFIYAWTGNAGEEKPKIFWSDETVLLERWNESMEAFAGNPSCGKKFFEFFCNGHHWPSMGTLRLLRYYDVSIKNRQTHTERQLAILNLFIHERQKTHDESTDAMLDALIKSKVGKYAKLKETLKTALGIKTDKTFLKYIKAYRAQLTIPLDDTVAVGKDDTVERALENERNPFPDWLSALDGLWFDNTRVDTNFTLRSALASQYFVLDLLDAKDPFRLQDENFEYSMDMLADRARVYYTLNYTESNGTKTYNWIKGLDNNGEYDSVCIQLILLKALCVYPHIFDLCLAAYMFSCGNTFRSKDIELYHAIEKVAKETERPAPAMSPSLISKMRGFIVNIMLATYRFAHGMDLSPEQMRVVARFMT
jgi:hypothetical protein